MTLSIRRFTRRPETVEAVQVTEDNMAEVAEWCGGKVENLVWRDGSRIPGVTIAAPTRTMCAGAGSWVVRNVEGGLPWVVSVRDAFNGSGNWQPALPSTAQPTEYRLSPNEVDLVVAAAEQAVKDVVLRTWDEAGYSMWDSAAAAVDTGKAVRVLLGSRLGDVLAERGEAGT